MANKARKWNTPALRKGVGLTMDERRTQNVKAPDCVAVAITMRPWILLVRDDHPLSFVTRSFQPRPVRRVDSSKAS